MNDDVRQFVENCDRVLTVGTLFTDFNSGAFTAQLKPERILAISHHQVRIGEKTYSNVEMGDILAALAKRLPRRPDVNRPAAGSLGEPTGKGPDPITAAALYPRWEKFLKPNDMLVAETGTASMGLGFAACLRERPFSIRRCGARSGGRRRRR